MVLADKILAWIAQAEADFLAAGVKADGIAECHRRFWLQQSYEKSIKALGLMLWTGTTADERDFEKIFLVHSPLESLSEAHGNKLLSKSLFLLKRNLDAEINKLDSDGVLRKVDGTIPKKEVNEISYRYPFINDGRYLAPVHFEGWDGYQGPLDGVQASARRLLKLVKNQSKKFSRGPK